MNALSAHASPGRPKDLAKRAAILEAAGRLFVQSGYEGVSMDQIAAAAGVSKLTVYSHFGDKERLFAAAVRAHCEQKLPDELFLQAPEMPLRARLLEIAQAFFALVTSPESVSGHRLLCSPQAGGASVLPAAFWDAGPQRFHIAFAQLLQRRIEAGELAIADPQMAAGHFFSMLKGQPHARLLLGGMLDPSFDAAAHVADVVDVFLRAYAVR